MRKLGMGLVTLGVVILITMLLCSCGSNPIAPPIDPPPVEPPIQMPEGAVVAYEDSTYTVLYDASNVYVYFHSGDYWLKFYIRPTQTDPHEYWDVKSQTGNDGYITWDDGIWAPERWSEHWDYYNDVVVLDEINIDNINYTLISFPRYTLDPDCDYRIEDGNYRIIVSPVDYLIQYIPAHTIQIN